MRQRIMQVIQQGGSTFEKYPVALAYKKADVKPNGFGGK